MKPALGLVLACIAAAPAFGTEEGASLFQRHCAACHGMEADGNGPMAAVLTLQPSDLTQLKSGNNGVFPIARVAARIDGRAPLVSHGSPMPLFGHLYERLTTDLTDETGATIRTSAEITALVAYLASLQR